MVKLQPSAKAEFDSHTTPTLSVSSILQQYLGQNEKLWYDIEGSRVKLRLDLGHYEATLNCLYLIYVHFTTQFNTYTHLSNLNSIPSIRAIVSNFYSSRGIGDGGQFGQSMGQFGDNFGHFGQNLPQFGPNNHNSTPTTSSPNSLHQTPTNLNPNPFTHKPQSSINGNGGLDVQKPSPWTGKGVERSSRSIFEQDQTPQTLQLCLLSVVTEAINNLSELYGHMFGEMGLGMNDFFFFF